MPEDILSVLDGTTFVVGDRRGDVRAADGREHGFFSDDTRFLSRWVLRAGNLPLELLSLHQDAHGDAQFVLTPRVEHDRQAPYSIVRRRLVDHVWMEEVTVTSHLHETSWLRLILEVDTDFADLFEVKDGVIAERTIGFTGDAVKLDPRLPTRGLPALDHDRVECTSNHRPRWVRLRAGAGTGRAVVDDLHHLPARSAARNAVHAPQAARHAGGGARCKDRRA